jgi:hypothetical protein
VAATVSRIESKKAKKKYVTSNSRPGSELKKPVRVRNICGQANPDTWRILAHEKKNSLMVPVRKVRNCAYQKAQPKNRKARVAIFNQVDKENYMAPPPPPAAENAENMPPAGYTQPPYGVRAKAGLLTQVSTHPSYIVFLLRNKITFLSVFRMRIRNFESTDPELDPY